MVAYVSTMVLSNPKWSKPTLNRVLDIFRSIFATIHEISAFKALGKELLSNYFVLASVIPLCQC
jgi:hypothetical protein